MSNVAGFTIWLHRLQLCHTSSFSLPWTFRGG